MIEREHWTVHLGRAEFVRYWARRDVSEAWGLGGWSLVVDPPAESHNHKLLLWWYHTLWQKSTVQLYGLSQEVWLCKTLPAKIRNYDWLRYIPHP